MKTLALVLFSLIITIHLYAQGGMAASPMKLEFTAAPGSSQERTITVSNPGNTFLEINANLNDWYRDSTGSINTPAAGSLSSSCSPWIKIFPSTHFTLAPGEQKEITVSVTPPANGAEKVCNSMLFFTQMNPERRKNKEGISIDMAVRIGIQVYYTPPGLTARNINIINFKDLPSTDSSSSRLLQLHLQNTGDLVADGKVDFELVNLDNGKKITFPHYSFYSLPGALRVISLPLTHSLSPGKYSATALVDFGKEEELKIGELEFNYSPGK